MVEVSESKSINKHLEPKNFYTVEKAIVLFFVKREYFLFGHRVLISSLPKFIKT